RVAAVIGEPVRHSLSPRLHNAAYRALGLDWVLVAFEVANGGAAAAIDAARSLDLVGYAVTMPHKTAIASFCNELSPDATALRSVNTVTVLADGRVAGDSTDGAGFLRSLAEAEIDPAGRTVLLLGAGGAARAVARSLGVAGAQVVVAARNASAGAEAAALAGGTAVGWDDRTARAASAGIVVNATPLGMARGGAPDEADRELFGAGVLGPQHVVVDLVYHPLETPLLRAAREQGATAVSGLGMLVHQAALQVERWTGQPAPLAAMRAAVAAEIVDR
ncbi:MAG: shikimate dehydrogenase, partial [Actinomycetota bacterium]|nr:shikimate dehydrogenase [Actinomycetota bacterium]